MIRCERTNGDVLTPEFAYRNGEAVATPSSGACCPVRWLDELGHNKKRGKNMQTFLTKQYVRMQTLLADERGQALIEYALVVALIAFA
jgi:hypothetical protein